MNNAATQQLYRVELSGLGFHVRDDAGTYVFGHTGCRHLNGVPTFAARHLAQATADDLNSSAS